MANTDDEYGSMMWEQHFESDLCVGGEGSTSLNSLFVKMQLFSEVVAHGLTLP